MKKVIVLGTNGMLGNSLFKNIEGYDMYGIQRKKTTERNIHVVEDFFSEKFIDVVDSIKPDVIINCVGIIKQKRESSDTIQSLPINSIFPHVLARYTEKNKIRLIHFSTDCIFDGSEGMYEDDSDFTAKDLYGISKYLGEIKDNSSALTLRVSIIGHGIEKNDSLIDWYLSQKGKSVKGYSNAYFSGFPCREIANILSEKILPLEALHGIYNLSSERISKYNLLKIVSEVYQVDIPIEKDGTFEIDRSLNSEKLRNIIGYKNKSWSELVKIMKEDFHE
ncbi:dTDP-4-dehydrorhamnose reductase family protein [Vibrio maritimus]|uniref:dTDP-4-dehydrorhamnose reductase family protein n=1 Tax=Vibrio maritimus TaxID=990268 RepID=UPI004067CD9B